MAKKSIVEKAKGFFGLDGIKPEKEIGTEDIIRAESQYGYDPITVSMLLGSSKRVARNRQVIYEKLHYMAGDPIITAAITLHVTNALGGDPETGKRVFIEPVAGISEQQKKLVEELNSDLLKQFNRIAFQIAFNGVAFGDSYARVYSKDKVGIVDLYTDEMVWPPLVQAYEQGSKTVGFTIFTGKNFVDRLTIKQMARLKMPRKNYIPQTSVIEKAVRVSITEDDPEKLPIQPALIGGSLLIAAEEPFDYLQSAITGMVGQRLLNSIDENLLTVNMTNMATEAQKKRFMDSLTKLLKASKKRAEDAISSGKPVTERIYHVIPVNGDKQVTSISQFQGTSGSQSFTVEDVMTYMKMLAGAIGIDLSMLGFADLLSGGLGEGGFFRTSAQAAEISMMIRTALSEFYYNLIDLHLYKKYGYVLDVKDRPYKVTFYGSISALEGEKTSSKEKSMNGTMMFGQALGTLKDLGLKKDTIKQVMVTEMGMDEDIAEIIATDMSSGGEEPPGGE